VRLAEMEGAVYALKRAENGCLVESVYKKELGQTPWVQMPLAVVKDRDDDHTYSLYALAAGDLEQAWQGRRHLAAAAASSAQQTDSPAEAASPAPAAPPAPAAQPVWSPAEFRVLTAETLVGLGQVHAVGVRHADVKPGNWLVTRDNHMCDLGSADDADCHAMAQGTPLFLAPEQRASRWELVQEMRQWLAKMAKKLGVQGHHRKVDVWQLAVSWL